MTAEKKVAILQPNYIPWKGYFDMIRYVDEFIFLDDVLYTKRDWRNRNLVKTPTGTQWLTIPVMGGGTGKLIRDTRIDGSEWKMKHWRTLVHNYSRAPYFDHYSELIKKMYFGTEETMLIKLVVNFIREINDLLGITTPLSFSSDYAINGSRNSRLLELCKAVKGNRYISGPAAKAYLDEKLFEQEGITVEWFDYSGYREYHQLFPPFEHRVTILDLLFNEGPDAKQYLKTLPLK